jgi:hypothetical protein
MSFYTHRKRGIDEVFPWEHIDVALTRRFLTQDYLMSKQEETRIDCRDQCFACGILPKLKDLRRETPPDAWECPPVTSIASRRARREDSRREDARRDASQFVTMDSITTD